ncbi:MAG: deoxyribodipyrimidine photo-lyase, partial [Chitinophagaceae bacterium]
GSSLFVLHDEPQQAFEKLLESYTVKNVFANHDYEPYAISRDAAIKKLLQDKNISFTTFKDQVVFEKNDILKQDGKPYTVFTPFSKQWKIKFEENEMEHFPAEKYFSNFLKTKQLYFPSLEEIGFKKTGIKIPPFQFPEILINEYDKTRNFPGIAGTSQVGIHLRFGTISIRQLAKKAAALNETFLNELIWREFFMMILFHFPKVVNHSFKRKYDDIAWRNNEDEFNAWCRGETGYPMVDAGMRQLNETGWMHNRVRMVTASFLTKHLLIDWRWGEAYFAEKLLDYELASNNGNWQWAAGSGCDAAPYFRIFNPDLQIKRFDPKLAYIKKWIPGFVPGYLEPIVDHAFARNRAIETFKKSLS